MANDSSGIKKTEVINSERFLPHLPAVLFLILTGSLLYSVSLDAPWYFDDYPNIVDNQKIRDLWRIAGNFFSPRGLSYLSFALDYHFWQLSPAPYRLMNVGLHLCNGLMVYWLIQVLVQRRDYAFWVALIFLAHPLQTQAVTYIVQRMTSLSCLFFLSALIMYVHGRKRMEVVQSQARLGWLLLAGTFLLGICSILTKENTAVLPAVLLLLEFFFIASGAFVWKKRLLFVLPFFLVPLLGLMLQVTDVASPLSVVGGGIEYFVLAQDGAGQVLADIQPEHLRGRYLATQAVVIWQYVGLFFWPQQQALDYCYPLVDSLLNWRSLMGGTGLLTLLAVAWRLRRLRPLISFGIGWFLLLLLVESSVIPLDAFFEHRMYVPLIGLGLVLVDSCDWFLSRINRFVLLALFVSPLLLLTWQRNELWTDKVAFWEDNISKHPFAYRPYENLGKAYYSAGDLWSAQEAFARALQLNPDAAQPHVGLGVLYDELGLREQAITLLEKALTMEGQRSLAAYSLGVVYEKTAEYGKAEEYYRLATYFDSKNHKGYLGLGVVLYHQGDLSAALVQFGKAIRLAPTEADALFNYASVALELGRVEESRSYLPRLKRLDAGFYRQLLRDIEAAELKLPEGVE